MDDFKPLYGEMEIISPTIRRITANNPMPFTFKGTGTYIVGHGNVAVIDPGPDMADHIDAILSELSDEKISHILVTHNHIDHSPGAKMLSDKTGVKIYGPDTTTQQYSNEKIEEGIDKSFRADVVIENAMVIKGDGWTLEAIHTPGHLSNHFCFAYKQENAIFTGDHVMGWSTTIVSPPDGNMQDYMDSLKYLLSRDDKIYYPTHGWPIDNPKQFVKQLYGHRLRREKEITRAIGEGAHSIKDIVIKIYVTIDERLYPAAARTIYAHLIRLVGLGSVTTEGTPSEDGFYHLPK